MPRTSLYSILNIAGVFSLLLAPSKAWMNQKDLISGRRTSSASLLKSEVNVLEDVGRQISTLGFGCFLAAATSFAAFGGPGSAFADAGRFSYDPTLGGPETWSSLSIEGNACSGQKQSPIAIRPTSCNVGANYEMKVSFFSLLVKNFSRLETHQNSPLHSDSASLYFSSLCSFSQELVRLLS